ncbi:hypothetical protein JOF56_007170 [Kibdelosporangium banguiense]|uniref:DUF2199 domain-containing protein n=1 Tax=Kibdelosporangium banguiense TaxID=1365924 RepID=A0ABS4TQV3_9PSEU|nr:DUF2199 domain-containing protein [Kibdelosporangium banguiense]MBP2326785.1 hypothetical protein [Kibdelosporangium banguiense]
MVADQTVRCGCCDAPIAVTDRMDIRAMLPDAAIGLPEENLHEITPGLLRVDGLGSFARCLLPVRLSGDLEVVFGVWIKIGDADLDHVAAVWDKRDYVDVVLHGTFANSIIPWGDAILGAPVTAMVQDVDEIPYIEASDDAEFEKLLTDVWDRDHVLSRFAHALPVAVRETIGERWSIERSAGMAARVVETGATQYSGPGRTVFVDELRDPMNRTADEMLAQMLENFPELPPEQIFTTRNGDEIRDARWLTQDVDGEIRHELYGYAIRPGSMMAIVCIHDTPEDHAWAMHVFNSIRNV